MHIPLDKLTDHPANANLMSRESTRILKAHIERTGRCPPLIVRPDGRRCGHYQIIDGHHRARALRALGHTDAECAV